MRLTTKVVPDGGPPLKLPYGQCVNGLENLDRAPVELLAECPPVERRTVVGEVCVERHCLRGDDLA
jgi:hypothetical protein